MNGKRILLIDDDPIVLGQVGLKLQELGHEVVVCEQGPEALQRATKERFDLMVLDLGLPSPDPNKVSTFDGFTVLRWLKRFPQTREMPVIVYTAREVETVRAEALSAGALAVVEKSAPLRKLIQAVQVALELV